jgi:hypothetical protein
MRQPHVDTLVYNVTSDEGIKYVDSAPIDITQDTWTGHVENGVLMCHMTRHFDSVTGARKDVDVYLRAWEIVASLEHGLDHIKLKYSGADVIDLAPPLPGDSNITVVPMPASIDITARLGVILLTNGNCLLPPTGFVASPNVETLWHRYEGFRRGSEPLLSMAYFCLTYIENTYGSPSAHSGRAKRVAAGHTLNVSPTILDKLGDLTALGDAVTARKIQPPGRSRSLTKAETHWVEDAIKKLIRRTGEYDYSQMNQGTALALVDMSDLPALI